STASVMTRIAVGGTPPGSMTTSGRFAQTFWDTRPAKTMQAALSRIKLAAPRDDGGAAVCVQRKIGHQGGHALSDFVISLRRRPIGFANHRWIARVRQRTNAHLQWQCA